jgi:hypothetical protein
MTAAMSNEQGAVSNGGLQTSYVIVAIQCSMLTAHCSATEGSIYAEF